MNPIHPFVCAALLLCAAAAPAQVAARATLSDPALDALVAEALGSAPGLTSARETAAAARHRVAPAGTLPDPFLSTTYQNDGRALSLGRAEGSFLGLMVSQPVPWPGKLALARRAAESEAREIELGLVGRAALTIEARVRSAWYDLALARDVDRIIDARAESASGIEAAVRERYAAGLAAQQDVIRAQIEVARLDELKASQRATISARTAELNSLLGRPQTTAVVTAGLSDRDVAPAADALIPAAAARSPELAAAREAIVTGRARIDAAKKNFLPDLVVTAGSMYRAGYEMGPMWQAGAGMTIPLWVERRQRKQLAEASALAAAREADAEVIARELELRTRERIAQLDAALRIAALYREKVLPLGELSLESAVASYRAGKVPFLTVLDALETLYGDRVAYAMRLAEAAKWRVAIDEAGLAVDITTQKAESRKDAAGESSMPSMR